MNYILTNYKTYAHAVCQLGGALYFAYEGNYAAAGAIVAAMLNAVVVHGQEPPPGK